MSIAIQNNSRRQTYSSLASVRLISGITVYEGEVINLSGHTTLGDDGGGDFYWDASSTATDDNGTIVKLADTTTGRFIRVDQDVISVKYFGATGDGSTNDTAAITLCLDSGAENVFVPEGIFVATGLSVPSTVNRIYGPGTIKHKTNASEDMISIADSNLTLDGITLDGDKGNQTGRHDLLRAELLTARYLTLSNVKFNNHVASSIYLNSLLSGTKVRVNDCDFLDPAESTSDTSVSYPNQSLCFYIQNAKNAHVDVTGCTFHQTTATNLLRQPAGIQFAGYYGTSTGLAITASGTTLTDTNNSFTADDVGDWVLIEGAGAAGVKLETRIASYTGVGEVEVEDAAATTVSSATGYWSTNEFSVTVTDNEFYQIGNAANPSSAIDIYQFAQNVIIKNNTIRKSPYGGIRVANSYNSTIEGNTVDGVIGTAGGGGIKIQGVTRANRAAAYLNHTIMGNVVLDWDATITEAFMIIGDGTNSVFQQNVLLADNIVKGGYGGVLLDGCENVELSGNIIDGITHTGSTTAGILIKRSPGPISIRGGWIRNCSTYGIYSGDSTNLVYSLHGINFQNNTFNHWRIAETDAIGVVDGCRHYGTPTQIGWEDTTQITVSNNTSPSSSTLNYGGSSVRHRWNNSIDLLSGSGTVDPASIPDGDEAAYDVTVTGATLGDYVLSCSFSIDVMDVVLSGQITSSNTVSVVFANNTGGAIDLGSGTLRVLVQKI